MARTSSKATASDNSKPRKAATGRTSVQAAVSKKVGASPGKAKTTTQAKVASAKSAIAADSVKDSAKAGAAKQVSTAKATSRGAKAKGAPTQKAARTPKATASKATASEATTAPTKTDKATAGKLSRAKNAAAKQASDRPKATKVKAVEPEAVEETSSDVAAKLELVALKGKDGVTQPGDRTTRRRSSAAPVMETVLEPEEPSRPQGLSSRAMSRQSRGKQQETGEVAVVSKVTSKPPVKKALLRYSHALPKWPASAEMLSLRFTLRPLEDSDIYPQYNVGLHAWFLKQVKQSDAELSRRLHDNADEKAFTLSSLDGPVVHVGDKIRLAATQTYILTLTVFSKAVVQWLGQWLKQMPGGLELKFAPMAIEAVELGLPAMSYGAMAKVTAPANPKLAMSFLSPTGFRRKGNHLPLPLPVNLFGSYLRRWNHFAKLRLEDEQGFLDWVDEHVVIARHVIHSEYRVVRSQDFSGRGQPGEELGGVTGFVGAVVLQLGAGAGQRPDFVDWWWRLGQFAPYCGTGHKTTFGLGQTVLGWALPESEEVFVSKASLIAQRRAELVAIFLEQRKQQGERARRGAETWATILARREQGESLMDIAVDLGLSHETTNKYAKLARRALRGLEGGE